MNINDDVDVIHRMLAVDPNYSKYLQAAYDWHAVEGSIAMDNAMAAQMIRTKALETGMVDLGRERLATIAVALGVVLRRYGMGLSPKTRRAKGAPYVSSNAFVVTPDGEAYPNGYREMLIFEVGKVHRALLKNEKDYPRFVQAVTNDQAVTGSLPNDSLTAAVMIRSTAREAGNTNLSSATLGAISEALGTVLRTGGQPK